MKSGIYQITNIVNNKTYIGSSIDFDKRGRQHFNNLKRNVHVNPHLQRSYNKHGKDNFRFEVLFTCPKEDLLRLEQYHIDNYNPEYNIYKLAKSSFSNKKRAERILSVKGKLDNRDNRRKHKFKTLKLTIEDILDIKRMLFNGVQQKHCAKKYNVTVSNISSIKREETWSDIKLDLNNNI